MYNDMMIFKYEECDYTSIHKKNVEYHERKHTGDLF